MKRLAVKSTSNNVALSRVHHKYLESGQGISSKSVANDANKNRLNFTLGRFLIIIAFMRNSPEIAMDFVNRDIIESVVIDWLNKYPLQGENELSVKNPNDPAQIKLWISGVWGRITHQILSSGLPFDDSLILNIARNSLYDQLAPHPWYEKVKPYLPQKPKG